MATTVGTTQLLGSGGTLKIVILLCICAMLRSALLVPHRKLGHMKHQPRIDWFPASFHSTNSGIECYTALVKLDVEKTHLNSTLS